MNNHSAKFEYRGMKIVGVTDYTNQTPSKHFEQKKMSKFKTPKNEKKSFMKCAKKGGAQFQCVDNYFAKFEYKGMKTA